MQISAPMIQRFLTLKLSWVTVRARTVPMISDTNKIKHVQFAKKCITTQDSFKAVIWTDESTIQLVRHGRSIRIKMGKEPNYKPVQSTQLL